jgi:hypothetical protein
LCRKFGNNAHIWLILVLAEKIAPDQFAQIGFGQFAHFIFFSFLFFFEVNQETGNSNVNDGSKQAKENNDGNGQV